MLTATYSLIAIAAEQKHARSHLQKLQQRLQTALKDSHHMDSGFLDVEWNKLAQFDQYCRNRKVETYLIPALRNADGEADTLISDLESLSAASTDLLRSIGERLAVGCKAECARIHELCVAMERYCRTLALRFDKEEQALLPLARRCLPAEAWFAIAAKLLAAPCGACEHGGQPRQHADADLAAMDAY